MVAGSSTAIIKSEAKKLKMRLVISVHTVFSRCLVRAAWVSSGKKRCFIKINVQEQLRINQKTLLSIIPVKNFIPFSNNRILL